MIEKINKDKITTFNILIEKINELVDKSNETDFAVNLGLDL